MRQSVNKPQARANRSNDAAQIATSNQTLNAFLGVRQPAWMTAASAAPPATNGLSSRKRPRPLKETSTATTTTAVSASVNPGSQCSSPHKRVFSTQGQSQTNTSEHPRDRPDLPSPALTEISSPTLIKQTGNPIQHGQPTQIRNAHSQPASREGLYAARSTEPRVRMNMNTICNAVSPPGPRPSPREEVQPAAPTPGSPAVALQGIVQQPNVSSPSVPEHDEHRAKRLCSNIAALPEPHWNKAVADVWWHQAERRLGRFDNSLGPDHDVKQPRYKILKTACGQRDDFYVALHQLFCVWSVQREIAYQVLGALLPQKVVDSAFKMLEEILRKNEAMSDSALQWFADFPLSLIGFTQRHSQHPTVAQIAEFLRRLLHNWPPLLGAVLSRRYPLQAFEVMHTLACGSPSFQNLLFTMSRRRLTLRDGPGSSALDELFSLDQTSETAFFTANATVAEVTQTRERFASQYIRVVQQLLARQGQQQAPNAAAQPANPGSPWQQVPTNSIQPPVAPPGQNPTQQPPPVGAGAPAYYPSPASMKNPTAGPQSAGNLVASPRSAVFPPSVGSPRSHDAPVPTHVQNPSNTMYPNSNPKPNSQNTNIVNPNSVNPNILRNGSFEGPLPPISHPPPQQSRAPMQNWQPQQTMQSNMPPHEVPRRAMSLHYPLKSVPSGPQSNSPQEPPRRFSQPNHQTTNQTQAHPNAFQLHPTSMTRTQPMPTAGVFGRAATGFPPHWQYARPSVQAQPRVGANRGPQDAPWVMRERDYAQSPYGRASLEVGLHQAELRSPRRISAAPVPSRYYQIIRNLACPPIVAQPQPGLRILRFTVPQDDMVQLSKKRIGHGIPFCQYSDGSLRYRLRLCIRPEKESSVEEADWVTSNCFWPGHIFIEVNGQPMPLRRKQHFHKDMPLELTDVVNGGENMVRVSLPQVPQNLKPGQKYFIAVEVVETRGHDYLQSLVQNTQCITAQETKERIRKRLQPSESDDILIQDEALSVSLTDPFSSSLCVIPVRGVNCLHLECFDLETWLQTRPKKPESKGKMAPTAGGEPTMVDVWKCPICDLDARPKSLRVDEYFVNVRRTLVAGGDERTRMIKVTADGVWTAVEEPEDSDDDEAAPTAAPRPGTKIGATNSAPQVIEILDD